MILTEKKLTELINKQIINSNGYLFLNKNTIDYYYLNKKNILYFLLNNEDEIIYIGKTTDIKKRLDTHKKNFNFFNLCVVSFESYSDLSLSESNCIKSICPEFNKTFKNEVIKIGGESPIKNHYSNAWSLLVSQLDEKSFMVAYKLSLMAKKHTNSLEPLNDNTTALELSSVFSVDRRYVHKIINDLIEKGVIAKNKNYWCFNPYLLSNGGKIHKDIPNLFIDTVYAKV